MGLFWRGRSSSVRLGMVASASGVSGRLLQPLERARVLDRGLEIGRAHGGARRARAGRAPPRPRARPAPDPAGGSRVVRCGLASRNAGRSGPRNSARPPRRAPSSRASGASKASGANGSRSYSQVVQRAQHQRDAARERAGVVLAQAELDRVQRGLDGQRVDAVARPASRSVSRISASIASASLGSMPFRPVE